MRSRSIFDWMFLGTILFYALSLIHITLATFGLICFLMPFIIKGVNKRNLWCSLYCPRASLLVKAFGLISLGLKPPGWLFTKRAKKIVVTFFIINLFFATMSTIMVSVGRIEPMAYVRFMMAFEVPLELPQLLNIKAPNFLVHLGYRVFSIMTTSMVWGFILAMLYKPRTWCGICPVNTLLK
jgi:hypothetical protein